MDELSIWAWAPLLGSLYVLVSWRTHDFFPFSRYAMYSSAVTRTVGAVPMFRVEGEAVAIGGYTDFSGFSPDTFYPPGIPCSLEWMVHEAQHYVEGHLTEQDIGDTKIEWGFMVISVDSDGTIQESFEPIQTGMGRRLSC